MFQKFLLSTPQNIRRFHALIATPLFMMCVLSNFYFFAGMAIGNQFVRRLFQGMRFMDVVPALTQNLKRVTLLKVFGHLILNSVL
jgi:hypothetical protein